MGVITKTLLGMIVVSDVITKLNLLVSRHDRLDVINRHVGELAFYGSFEIARRLEHLFEIRRICIFAGNDGLGKKRCGC